ncbi:unnamed protein product [Adineta ricciae]|uniref:Uncharacterized protein n=1 Tax=Adineta ricciae TaxID=249248 RepID=A0A816FK08_ADIRI|nr:unnamed protein product [Adineta ricciae]CAF1662459.1 unnamed protein product [Adineta ricciae]
MIFSSIGRVAFSYSGFLTAGSNSFRRPGGIYDTHYFKALEVIASTSGHYAFASGSTTDLYGCLYDSFSQYSPFSNLIECNDDYAPGVNFRLEIHLLAYQSKVLVVTTYEPSETASFDLKAYGPGIITGEDIPYSQKYEID